jgi:hypothetical protein
VHARREVEREGGRERESEREGEREGRERGGGGARERGRERDAYGSSVELMFSNHRLRSPVVVKEVWRHRHHDTVFFKRDVPGLKEREEGRGRHTQTESIQRTVQGNKKYTKRGLSERRTQKRYAKQNKTCERSQLEP